MAKPHTCRSPMALIIELMSVFYICTRMKWGSKTKRIHGVVCGMCVENKLHEFLPESMVSSSLKCNLVSASLFWVVRVPMNCSMSGCWMMLLSCSEEEENKWNEIVELISFAREWECTKPILVCIRVEIGNMYGMEEMHQHLEMNINKWIFNVYSRKYIQMSWNRRMFQRND